MMPEHVPASSSDDTAARITAIETSYKGYRFRSRLEARWAVFFDHLKWSWKYEPQGYDIGTDRYLPDFWVDELGWVEIKGSLDRAGLLKIGLAAGPDGLPLEIDEASLTPTGLAAFMGPRFSWIDVPRPDLRRILLLGDIPSPDRGWLHNQIALQNGRHVVVRHVFLHSSKPYFVPMGEWFPIGVEPYNDMPHGCGGNLVPVLDLISAAYRAARSARFEHGQSGAV